MMYNEYDENQVNKLARKRKKRRLKKKVKLFLFLLITILLICFITSDIPKIKTIHVSGLDSLSQEKVLSSLSIDQSSYYMFMSPKQLTKEVESMPEIKSANVKCDLIGNVNIHVEEALPIAYAILDKKVYELNEIGNVFEVTNKEKIQELKSYPQLHDFQSLEMLKQFANEFKNVPSLMQSEMSDIILISTKVDPTALKCILKNKKIIQIRIEDLSYRLSEEQFNYEAYKVGFKSVCTFKFEGKYLYLEDCKK